MDAKIHRAAALILAILPAIAMGQIHMCEGPDGRKVFPT
jgi:hypothetical protein